MSDRMDSMIAGHQTTRTGFQRHLHMSKLNTACHVMVVSKHDKIQHTSLILPHSEKHPHTGLPSLDSHPPNQFPQSTCPQGFTIYKVW